MAAHAAPPSPGGPDETPEAVAARVTGRSVTGRRRLSAGVTEVTLTAGGSVIVKHGEEARAVRAEAAGLRWLAEAGAVPVPAVRGEEAYWLVTDRVSPGEPTAEAAERFGRDLAALHASGAAAFGAPPPGGPREAYIGRAPMRDVPGAEWPRWYAEHRVLPYLRRAVDEGTVGPAEARPVEEVCGRLPELAGPPEPPARLHGDLWNGNVLWGADGRAWLIDPAAHGGHRETDLAMLRLFGCPGLDRILGAYRQAAPLAEGWRDRIGLHQLFPLLVHTVLFGRGYAGQALAAARSALRA
ncbi:fructosamine kinase family protein [Streptomyces griseoaurantiacus]|uniref:Fructosamine-3-kinase n=1 Tax=Streptomyces griseoaurantiacus TaxID=68213 RepID=A0A1G7E0I0_9ACTN|nr:fructosamine kinase family protein [Streptomyces jietaisiensis]SDE56966.1 Fructosamine-3-kinase [Streptomyces jietaisiensis]